MYHPRPPSLRSTSQTSISTLKDDLQRTGKVIVLVHLPDPSTTDNTSSPSTLPPSPPFVQQHLLEHLQSLPQPVNVTDISTLGLKLVESLKYTPQQRLDVEASTWSQGQSKRWFEEHQFRLTASKFGVIVKRKKQHTSLVYQLMYTSVSPSYSGVEITSQTLSTDTVRH